MTDSSQQFEQHRDLLVSVAYRILGSVSDAEDVVQEAWLRWDGVTPTDVADPKAFLVRVTSRLAIDRLRRVKARRETYIGPWLPEPMATRRDVAEEVVLAESVSMAMLVVLETLSPLERTVFVLREAFRLPYNEIAEVLGRTEAAVRQLARRARTHVDERAPRFDADEKTRYEATQRFLRVSDSGDLESLLEMLAPDVELVGDGGGLARAPRRPVVGAERVARFVLGALSYPFPDLHMRVTELNGGPGIVFTSEGSPVATVLLDVHQGLVRRIYVVANPDKLKAVSEL